MICLSPMKEKRQRCFASSWLRITWTRTFDGRGIIDQQKLRRSRRNKASTECLRNYWPDLRITAKECGTGNMLYFLALPLQLFILNIQPGKACSFHFSLHLDIDKSSQSESICDSPLKMSSCVLDFFNGLCIMTVSSEAFLNASVLSVKCLSTFSPLSLSLSESSIRV